MKTEKSKKAAYLALAMAALVAAGGLWFGRTAWRPTPSGKATMADGVQASGGQPTSGATSNPPALLEPPDPARIFADFTPEERVEFARRGHGPGG